MRSLLAILVMGVAVAACGGSDTSASQAPIEATSTEAAIDEDGQPATTTTTTVETTTTTTEAPDDVMTAEDAEEMTLDLLDSYGRYINDVLDGDASFQEAIEVLSVRNPDLYASDITDDGIALQTCVSEVEEEIITFEAFYDIEVGSFDFVIDILETIEVRPGVWVVDFVQTTSAEGLPESVERQRQIMTVEGVGPTVLNEEASDEDNSCSGTAERSPEGDELVAEVEAFLAAE